MQDNGSKNMPLLEASEVKKGTCQISGKSFASHNVDTLKTANNKLCPLSMQGHISHKVLAMTDYNLIGQRRHML